MATSKKRPAPLTPDHRASSPMAAPKKKKTAPAAAVSLNTNESPIAGTRITDWEEYEKWKEVRGDIEPTMNYVEITPEAIEELRKIKNVIGDYICQLCKVKYENAFALAMHKCPRVVHIEFRCPECDKTFNCPANLASHRRWHKPQSSAPTNGSASTSAAAAQKPLPNKQPRCASRSDSRSTHTSSSTTTSEPTHEYPPHPASSSKEPVFFAGMSSKASEHVFRAMCNGTPQRMLPPLFPASLMKQPLLFPQPRPAPISLATAFDFRRLQSSCIFCHEQFSELSHLLQHIRKNHAVTSSTNTQPHPLTLDKLIF